MRARIELSQHDILVHIFENGRPVLIRIEIVRCAEDRDDSREVPGSLLEHMISAEDQPDAHNQLL
jgi:hypothetical protein